LMMMNLILVSSILNTYN
jgi:hypothetical protein